MPGIDYVGGDTNSYNLGRGILTFADEATPLAFRDMGNCTDFTIQLQSETKEHQSSLEGLKTTDLEVVLSQKMSVSFSLDELNINNLGAFFLGTIQGNGADPTAPLVNTEMINPSILASNNGLYTGHPVIDDILYDLWYDIIVVGAVPILINGIYQTNFRAYDFESTQTFTVIFDHAGTPVTLTERNSVTPNGDYELDRRMGRIRFFRGGTHSLSTNKPTQIQWTAGAGGRSTQGGAWDADLFRVNAMLKSGIQGTLKFLQENPVTNTTREYMFFQVTLKPEGDFAGIGDDWSKMTFTGSVERVATPPYGESGYLQITERTSYAT